MTENEAIERFQKCVENNGKCECCKFYVNCGIYEMEELAIKALEEVQQYRQIGTVEECQAAVEMRTAKKPIDRIAFKECPTCGHVDIGSYGFCERCGQHIDWRDEE